MAEPVLDLWMLMLVVAALTRCAADNLKQVALLASRASTETVDN